MADNTNPTHTYRETRVERSGGGGTAVLAFIVGALLVALVAFFMLGSGDVPAGAGDAGDRDVTVTIERDLGAEGPGVLPDAGVEGPGVVVDRGADNN